MRAFLSKLAGVAVSAFVLLALLFLPAGSRATSRLGVSPHEQAGACPVCHDSGAEGTVGPPRPVEATCRSCHPDADMHPVGMSPREVHVAEGWPLEAGKLTCATCHAEPSCDDRRGRVAPWFRGGNPERVMDFCYRCHTPGRCGLLRTRAAGVDGNAGGCPACHQGKPAAGAPPAQAELRLPGADTCTTCHPGPVHAGVAEHLGEGVTVALAPEAAAALPLGEGNAIMCWTCHDVHRAGPDTPHPPAGFAARLARLRPPTAEGQRPALLALSVQDGSLCRACHGGGP